VTPTPKPHYISKEDDVRVKRSRFRMTKRDGLFFEMYCPQGPGDKLATSAIIEKTNTPLLGMYLAPRSDEPGTTLERRQVHQPLEPDHQAVAKADQVHEMQDQPHDPS